MRGFLRAIIISALVLTGGFVATDEARAAKMYPSPLQSEVAVNDTFIVEFHLHSDGDLINAAQAEIEYDPDLLSVVDISRTESFLLFWAEEPRINEAAGVIRFIGGVPGGTYVFDSNMVSVTFRARHTGISDLKMNTQGSSVHLNDGLGTTAPLRLTNGTVQISHPNPDKLVISSPSHPDENSWYQTKDVVFEWTEKADSFYSYTLSRSPTDEPDRLPEAETGRVEFSDVSDGIHYFILNEKIRDDEWQLVGQRRVMIDSVPPLEFEIELSQETSVFGGNWFISFATSDRTSGIYQYEVVEGNEGIRPATSPYQLKSELMNRRVIVRAYDKAENVTEAYLDLPFLFADNESASWLLVTFIAVLCVLIVIFAILYLSRRRQSSIHKS
ncbi:MAG: cohesin domain-containing protein [bacterium]|nr:cohesin domain-containing protein [bacterium]